jgi:hypothetical protein
VIDWKVKFDSRFFAGILASLCTAFAVNMGHAATLPTATTIPVVFTHTLEAGKVKPGEAVTAKTMQVVILPNGRSLPKGTILLGRVQQSHRFTFDPTPYAVQQPSVISVHFEKIMQKGESILVSVSVRALANTIDSREAASPKHLDETDSVGTNVQIGDDSFSPLEKEVRSEEGDIVGYNRKQGVFARLISNDYTSRYASFHCAATDSEQSVAIFSAGACGVYGFDTVYMSENGTKTAGSFSLESKRHSVKLYAGSSALLQVIEDSNSANRTKYTPAGLNDSR